MVYVRLHRTHCTFSLTLELEFEFWRKEMDVSASSSVQFLISSGSSPVQDSSTIKWPKCTKTYNSRWETDPLLKTWISRHPEDTGKVVCNFCQSVIRAHKNDLLEHTRTLKHQRNFMAHATPEEYNLFVMELNELRKDAQMITKKKVSGGKNNSTSQSNSNSNSALQNSTNNSWTNGLGKNNSIVTVVSSGDATPPPGVLLGGGTSGGGACDVSMDIWPSDMNNDGDSFLSADSPSDLVSVILEETDGQQCGNGGGSDPASPPLSGNSNDTPPTLTPNHPHHPHTSPSPAHVSLLASGLQSCERLRPFTCSDVLAAMEDNYFSWTELWSLAKCALRIIERGSEGPGQSGVNNLSDSPQPPDIHSQNQSPQNIQSILNTATAISFTPFHAINNTHATISRSTKRGSSGRRKPKRSKLTLNGDISLSASVEPTFALKIE